MFEHAALSSPEEIIRDVRDGKMVILVDDEDRENEGDLVVAAEAVTPEIVNFMAREACGLICLTLTREYCLRLGLRPMVDDNRASHATAFTVSIEAAHGVTTGISAYDRAVTVKAAVAANAMPADIVSPGHIFPLCAKDGGVLARTGHTEAGSDLARLAGFAPASVICEVMNPDGTMARLPQLREFGARHGIRVGTIASLVAWRKRHDPQVWESARSLVMSDFGVFEKLCFSDGADAAPYTVLIRGTQRDAAAFPVGIVRLAAGSPDAGALLTDPQGELAALLAATSAE
uniref:3,4-dihydroxy-2-butanone-4-phosphate synthase n=1 Tax=Burkholderia sp. Ac-20379 TaxID=2703900 RepID=UPI0019824E87